MLDCGNSRARNSYSKRDSLRDLVDSLKFSKRRSKYYRTSQCACSCSGEYNNSFETSCGINYDRRNSGSNYSGKTKGDTCNSGRKPVLEFDGGNSTSVYVSGPIFDCGNSGV